MYKHILPQNVSTTKNAYYATMAVLYNILVNENKNMKDINIIFTSMCCGYGKMDDDMSIQQITQGINDYSRYEPNCIYKNIIITCYNLIESSYR